MRSSRVRGFVLFSFVVLGLHAPRPGTANVLPVDAVGRLVLNGRFMCTAFTIRSEELPALSGANTATYRNWLVTAGHCLDRAMFRAQPTFLVNMRGEALSYPARPHPIVPTGYSSGRPEGLDVAVLVYSTSRPVPTLEPAFNHLLREGEPLLLAGYPNGVLLFSVGPFLGRNEYAQLIIGAHLSSGSSGGPVLLPGTRQVVGIIVEGTIRDIEGTPYGCLFRRCPAGPPDKAAPIDWILRVMHW